MESRSKVFGHPLHTVLVVFPLGLFLTAVIFDVVGLFAENKIWHVVAYYMIGAGVVGGILAAIPGIIDWIAIPMGTRAKAVGLSHGLGNIAVISLFGIEWLMRGAAPLQNPNWMALVLGFIAFGLGGMTAWLGGEMTTRLGVGIDRGANLNAPNSLTGRPAADTPNPRIADVDTPTTQTPAASA